MTWQLALIPMIFVLGLAVGKILADRLWRQKATSGYRMASGGKLYFIIEEHPMIVERQQRPVSKSAALDAWD